VLERPLARNAARGAADDRGQLELPVGLRAAFGQDDVVVRADHRVRRAEEHKRLAARQPVLQFGARRGARPRCEPIGAIAASLRPRHQVEHVLAVVRARLEDLSDRQDRGQGAKVPDRKVERVRLEPVGERLEHWERGVPVVDQLADRPLAAEVRRKGRGAAVTDDGRVRTAVLRRERGQREGGARGRGHRRSVSTLASCRLNTKPNLDVDFGYER
jgi:hypothetical protein